MPTLVVHLLIPPLVLLATRRFDWRLILLLLPFSLVPDIDFFLPPHRALLHTLFLPAALGIAAWRWQGQGHGARADVALIAAFYLASHSLMDIFAGGVVLFWPVTDQTFFIDVQVLINTRTLETFPIFEPGSQGGVPEVTPIYEFLNGENFAIFVLAMVVAAGLAVRRALTAHREVVVVAEEPRAPGKRR